MKMLKVAVLLAAFLALAACQFLARQVSESPRSQLEIRSIQTRAFDSTDRERILRAIVATLQDLDFVIFHADYAVGSVSGKKPSRDKAQITVSIHPRGATQLVVRANARFNGNPITEPEPYQQFFTALGRAMFLEAQGVD
jgi:outer membrane lipopolysaccharide assembly protein LptE/RlpB